MLRMLHKRDDEPILTTMAIRRVVVCSGYPSLLLWHLRSECDCESACTELPGTALRLPDCQFEKQIPVQVSCFASSSALLFVCIDAACVCLVIARQSVRRALMTPR